MRYLASIFDVIDQYDCLLCDINGVIADGTFLLPKVESSLYKLQDKGKHIIFVSNATRTKEMVKTLMPFILLFNLTKAGINGAVTYLVYKRIHKLFSKLNLA